MAEFETFRLSNGIRCVHRHVNHQVAHIALTIGSGTRDELADQHGVAHLVEHLMFKGTHKRSSYHINSLLENSGGELNAYTTKEETVIHATLLSGELRKGIDLLSDMAFNSTFSEVELGKERDVIIDEINSYKDSPAELIFDEFEERLFVDSPLGRNILGSKRNLQRATREQLISYVSGNYLTDRVVFSAASNMDHRKFRTLCEIYFGGINSNNSISQRATPSRISNFTLHKNKKTYQTHCLLGGYAYQLGDAKRLQLLFLINLLGGPFSTSRLNMQLREKHALTYSIEAGYVPYCDTGLYTIYFGCDSEKLERSLNLVERELKNMMDNQLTSLQLSRYKKQFQGQLTIASESNENVMLGVAKSLLSFDTFDSNDQIAQKINSITSMELLEVANEIFNDANRSLLVYK